MVSHEGSATTLVRSTWSDGRDRGTKPDPDANFRADVALYSVDPMETIDNLAAAMTIPEGALARHIRAKWASAGSIETTKVCLLHYNGYLASPLSARVLVRTTEGIGYPRDHVSEPNRGQLPFTHRRRRCH